MIIKTDILKTKLIIALLMLAISHFIEEIS
jgi:hypothetical protein